MSKTLRRKNAMSYHSGIALRHKEICEYIGFPKVIEYTDECIYSNSSSDHTNTVEHITDTVKINVEYIEVDTLLSTSVTSSLSSTISPKGNRQY